MNLYFDSTNPIKELVNKTTSVSITVTKSKFPIHLKNGESVITFTYPSSVNCFGSIFVGSSKISFVDLKELESIQKYGARNTIAAKNKITNEIILSFLFFLSFNIFIICLRILPVYRALLLLDQ